LFKYSESNTPVQGPLKWAGILVLTSHAHSELITLGKASGKSETATFSWLDNLGEKMAA
jgi:hypothetical protein